MTTLGQTIAPHLGAGDLVALAGGLGAGKSHLARAIIHARLDDDTAEVASPTYTIVNVYDAGPLQIWHADLYRLGEQDELIELGLTDAIADALILLEWPDRWQDLPPRRLEIGIVPKGTERFVSITAKGSDWDAVMDALKEARWIVMT